MENESSKTTDNQSVDVFDDILNDPNLQQVSFVDQQLTGFDAASAARQAAAHAEETPKKRFGKRSARKKTGFAPTPSTLSFQTAPAEPQQDAAPIQEAPAAEPAGSVPEPAPAPSQPEAAPAVPKAPGVMAAQIQARELEAARAQTEPYEKATFVKPVAAQVVLNGAVKTPVLEPEVDAREEELFANFEEPGQKTGLDGEEVEVIDPGSSLVDDYDYDLYEDKKHFMLTDYPRIEEYLARQSKQGYHYVRQEGHHYYFHHGFPKNYYYQILYFNEEPPQAQWDLWEEKGWHMLHHTPGTKKKEAGWYVMRNEQQPGMFRQEIENEEEKYRFFRSYSNSCRSTMFLLFICMAVCLVMGMLQYFFRGHLYGILFALILFCIALWCFLIYGRMLAKSNKQVRLLKAKLRLANSEHSLSYEDLEENQKELDEDWDHIDQQKQKAARKRKS